jgi:CheY-like chemotaxis protein
MGYSCLRRHCWISHRRGHRLKRAGAKAPPLGQAPWRIQNELSRRRGRCCLAESLFSPLTHALVILVVEDEFFVRCNVTDCLRKAGYSVVETASGEEAIAFCKSNISIDVVFTDISLIGSASGWDVAECFRADRPNVSLIYTSGKSLDSERRVDGSAFIAKPYRCDDVVDACQRLCEK